MKVFVNYIQNGVLYLTNPFDAKLPTIPYSLLHIRSLNTITSFTPYHCVVVGYINLVSGMGMGTGYEATGYVCMCYM